MAADDLARIPLDLQLAGGGLDEVVELARAAEERGFSRLWAPELYRSSTVPLAAAAAGTARIELATGISLAFTRSPLVTALELLDLDEMSGGRAVLGLGAGARRLNERWHAAAYDPPLRRMRELVAAVREIVASLREGRDARAPGRYYDISMVGFRREWTGPRDDVPIWLAAVRPGMTALAGEVADGFLDHPVTSPAWLEERLVPALRSGAERAGRSAPPVAAAAICAVDDADPERAHRAAALSVGFYATVKTYAELFEMHGFGSRLPGVRRAFMERDADRLAEAVGSEMAATFSVSGTSEEVRRRLAPRLATADRLWLTVPHHDQGAADTSRWQRALLDTLGR